MSTFEHFARSFQPMLVSQGSLKTIPPDWVCEPKLDGMRAIAVITDGTCRLFSRHGLDHSVRFPGVVRALASHSGSLIIDGELICLTTEGKPCFDDLRDRILLDSDKEIRYAEEKYPAHFYAFDIVYKDRDLTTLPYLERRSILSECLLEGAQTHLVRSFETGAAELFAVCLENKLEGIVAKRPDSVYRQGVRTSYWLKVKEQTSDSFVIGGHTEDHGFLVGQFADDGKFVYCGNVETGFRNVDYDRVFSILKSISESPFAGLKRNRTKWFVPDVIVDLKFMRWSARGKVRDAVFLRFREDLRPEDVVFHWAPER